jgi:hypothetical protein
MIFFYKFDKRFMHLWRLCKVTVPFGIPAHRKYKMFSQVGLHKLVIRLELG